MRKAGMLLVAFLLGLTLFSPVAAQDAPAGTPVAAECTVAPIDATTYYEAVMNSVPPLQQPINPEGPAASEEIAAAVTEVIQQSVACTNAGDFARLLAVIDPSYAPALIGVPYGQFEAALHALVEGSLDATQATPMVDDVDQSELNPTIVSVTNVLDHGNGIISAVAQIESNVSFASTFTIYLRVQEATGQYVIFYYAMHDLVTPIIPAGF